MARYAVAFPAIPSDTARTALAQLPADSPFHTLAQVAAPIFAQCRAAAPAAWSDAQVVAFVQQALLALLQIAEGLTDRQAAEAARTRLEWKVVLHRPLNWPGPSPASFCLFRQRLAAAGAENAEGAEWPLFARVAAQWPIAQTQPAPLREALAAACERSRAQWKLEAMAQALESLAVAFPAWLLRVMPAHWYTRYTVASLNPARDPTRGPVRGRADPAPAPASALAPEALAADANSLLDWLGDASTPPAVRALPEVRRLLCARALCSPAAHGWAREHPACASCAVGICIANGCAGYGETLAPPTPCCAEDGCAEDGCIEAPPARPLAA